MNSTGNNSIRNCRHRHDTREESLPLRLQKYETMQLRASLADRPPYRKFLILVGLTLVFAVLLTGIGAWTRQRAFWC